MRELGLLAYIIFLLLWLSGCAARTELRIVQSMAVLEEANTIFINGIEALHESGEISDAVVLRLLEIAESTAQGGILVLDLSEQFPETSAQLLVAIDGMIFRLVDELDNNEQHASVRATLLSLQSALTAVRTILEIQTDATSNIRDLSLQYG